MNIIKFALISGLGLGIDLLVFKILILFLNIFSSSFISSTLGVSFVYLASKYFSLRSYNFGLIKWLLYQIFNISFFSIMVALLANPLKCEICAKTLVVPFSFSLNYFVINILLKFKE